MTPAARRRTAPLFTRLLALILLSLVAAQAVSMLMIFSLPPPVPDFYRISEVIAAYHGQPQAFSERRPLEVVTARHAPSPAAEGRMTGEIRHGLAARLGLPVDDVVIAYSRGPYSDRRIPRLVRDRIERDGGDRDDHFVISPFKVGVRQPDGAWRVIRPVQGLGLTPWQQRVLLWFVLSALATAPFVYLFSRRLSEPISRFAEAAERLGRDPGAQPLELSGWQEVNVAVDAFNGMQERLRRYVEDRTAMVGAIAHDLRTPLTRLRFRIENAPDELRAKMAADLDQMEEMITAALAFVRDASRPSERTPLELSSLVESLCDEMAETGADVSVERSEKVVLEGDPLALRRLLANLVENAIKFGLRARARVWREGAYAVIEVDDDGPGIPLSDMERVFDPFYRREPSRSRQTGGAGLGLAVVRSIARGHGGDVVLRNRPDGGLTARVQLPL